MSVRSRRRLTIREAATRDIDDALLYTRKQWGIEQRRRYRDRLYKSMRSLIDHPELGSPRDTLFLGCRGLLVEQHIIFYRLTEDEIIVGRVLHGNQEATGKVLP